MDRRGVGRAALGAGIALAAGASAWADDDEDDYSAREGPGLPAVGAVRVWIGGQQVLIASVVVATKQGSYISPLGHGQPQFYENRITMPPLLDGFFRQTPRRRVETTEHIGKAVMFGRALIVVPDQPGFAPPRDLVLLAGKISWDLPDLRPATLPGLAGIEALRRLPGVGSARASGSQLAVFLPPVATLAGADI
jgi:hypothetical protein